MSTYKTLLEEFKDLAELQGWKVVLGGNDHWQFWPKNGGQPMVTASNSPSDVNAIHQVRRQLVASGLKIPDEREQHMEKRARKSVSPTVKALFKENPDKTYFTREVDAYVKMKVGEIGENSVNMALTSLASQGFLIRVGRGEYRFKKEHPAPPPKLPETPLRRSFDIAEYAANTEDEKILNESLAALGKIEDKIKETLSEALISLGRIEEVVRRNRDVAKLLVELKEKLK